MKKQKNFEGMKNIRKSMKNVRNPHFLRTLPHILHTFNNYLVFSNFKSFQFIFYQFKV